MKNVKLGAFLLVVLPLIVVANNCVGATQTLNVTVEGQGEVNRNPSLAVYPNGATVTLTAIPIDGWMFSNWSGDATGIENPLNLLMDADKSVVAKFELIPVYPLSVAVVGAGSVEPSEGMYRSNSLVNLTATPSNGWVFVRWSGDDDSTANPLAVTMSRPMNLSAIFAELPHIVEEPQSVNVNAGENVSFEVSAAGAAPLNYEWSFDGSILSGETNRILTISNAQPSQAGGYSVRVFNAYGSVTSTLVSLILFDSCVGSNLVTVCDEASLRSAISIGGVVRFCCNGTITLSNTIDVATDVILDASEHEVVISGGGAVRLFSVRAGGSLSMTNVTLANGRHQGRNGAVIGTDIISAEYGGGGAIFNDGGTVNLVSCVLSNNVALGGNGAVAFNGIRSAEIVAGAASAWGGGVYNLGGIVRLHSVMAISNVVAGGLGAPTTIDTNGYSSGGFVASIGGEVIVSNSRLIGNSAKAKSGGQGFAGPGPFARNAMGGAAYLVNANLTVEDSALFGNEASGEPVTFDIGNPASGEGGAVYILSGNADFVRSVMSSNIAIGSDGFRYTGAGNARGGAVFNLGQIQMRDVTLSQNSSVGGGGSVENGAAKGGGIFNGASAVLERVTLSRNSSLGGLAWPAYGVNTVGGDGLAGGIWNSGSLSATNCTIALNSGEGGAGSVETGAAGGMASGGGIFNQLGTLSLMNVTVASNLVVIGERSPPSLGANLADASNGTLRLRNSIVAGGQGASNSWGVIVDGGFNMSSDGSCAFASGTSFNFTDPKLGPLGFHGGFTETMELSPESPAIDFGTTDGAPEVDQRGKARPFGLGVDIGAYEAGMVAPVLVAGRDVLRFEGAVGVAYELWGSSDMKTWKLVTTLQPVVSGTVEWLVPAHDGAVFFRLIVR